jgi:20S proteasome alpha/beta subunit
MRLRANKLRPVTLIVGIIAQQAVVIAGDSQTTAGVQKSWATNKITRFDCGVGPVLIAESGAETTSANVIQELQSSHSAQTVTNAAGFARELELAAQRVVRRLYQNLSCTPEQFQRLMHEQEIGCGLMVAYYAEGKPVIQTVSLSIPITMSAKKIYNAIGCGATLAEYFLEEICSPDMNYSAATMAAVQIVELVKKIDLYCGGPVKLARLIMHMDKQKPPVPQIFSQQEVDEMVATATKIDDELKLERRDRYRTEYAKRAAAALMAQMPQWTPDWSKPLPPI